MDRPGPLALRYYLYRAAAAVEFTAPIWYLYLFEHGLTYTEVAVVNAVWWVGLIVFELPTGYVADRVGRRESLVVGTATTVVATLAMIPAHSVGTFGLVMAFWALGQTFLTGADDAWLFDALDGDDEAGAGLDRTDFVRVRGRGTALALLVTGVTALAGGVLAESGMDYAYLAGAAGTVLAIPAIYGFPEAGGSAERFTVLDAVPVLRAELGRPHVRSFVLLVALLTGVHWGVNFFVQPVAVDLGFSTGDLGVLYAAFTVAGALVSYNVEWIADRVGIPTTFRVLPVALGGTFVAVAFVPALAIPAFLVLRVARSAVEPLAAAWLNERVESLGRATVLSAAGMVYTVLTVPFELGAGVLADLLGPLSTIGLFGAVLVAGSVAIVLLGRPFAGDEPTRGETGAPSRDLG